MKRAIAASIVVFALASATSLILKGCKSSQSALPELVSYNFDIRPILSDNCYACHGPDENARKADFRLDMAEGALKELKDSPGSYAIVPGNPATSKLLTRINATDPSEMMPPPESHLSLSQLEISLIEKWISQGAPFEKHWAYIPPSKPDLKSSASADWSKNEIDHFTFQKMIENGLKPNEVADPSRLIRRLSFDLTGLPPSPELQDRYTATPNYDTYLSVVDELMTSDHYGEKMALHWLDIARYADSHGYQDDGQRTMWPWRDWVIHAFNKNYPYDKFISWQLAGDLIDDKNKESILATGFNRNHKITQEGGVIDEEYRVEYVTDRTNTFSKGILGMTMECAKCHDHKFDEISQKEYFSTFAFFDKVPEKGLYADIGLGSLADPPFMTITDEDVEEILTFVNKKIPEDLPVMIMKDSIELRESYLLDRGLYDAKTEIVKHGTPSAILPFDSNKFTNSRLGLADWLFEDDHPLTARVYVNRMWQEFFGKGIVNTVGDFGVQGALPTHPELLDWLAVDFRENGWDMKRLVRQIVTSSTYMQSSKISDDHREIDAENIYLARMPRRRLPAEFVRDMVLKSSGLLNQEIGGASVKPYQPDGLWSAATSGRSILQKYVQDHDENLYRRGMYTFIKRTVPPPVMLTFDASNRDQCEVNRYSTNTPLQALIMLNDPTVLEASRVLAEKLSNTKSNPSDQITTAGMLILSREFNESEMEIYISYYEKNLSYFREDQELQDQVLNIGEMPLNELSPEISALMQVIHMIYNLDEAIVLS